MFISILVPFVICQRCFMLHVQASAPNTVVAVVEASDYDPLADTQEVIPVPSYCFAVFVGQLRFVLLS